MNLSLFLHRTPVAGGKFMNVNSLFFVLLCVVCVCVCVCVRERESVCVCVCVCDSNEGCIGTSKPCIKRESALVKCKCSSNYWSDVLDGAKLFQKWKKLKQLFIITVTSPRGDWNAIV
jgi:hypothetical protein